MSELQHEILEDSKTILETHEINQNKWPGATLAEKRKAKDWSIEYVAHQLKLAVKQVSALEENNYAILPELVIVRGFVRSYAKLLGIDSTDLVASLPREKNVISNSTSMRRILPTPFFESSSQLERRNKITIYSLIFSTLLMISILSIVILLNRIDWFRHVYELVIFKKNSNIIHSNTRKIHAQSVLKMPVVQNQSLNLSKKTSLSFTKTISQALNTSKALNTNYINKDYNKFNNASIDILPSVLPISSISNKKNVYAAKNLLQLKLYEDSWIDMRKQDKSIVVSRILTAGTTKIFNIVQPVTLIIGNVAGVNASLRGVKLNLLTYTNKNVARLNFK